MKYESIADVYSANEKIAERLRNTLSAVTEQEAVALPDGEKWTIQQIAEHVVIVEHNIMKLCARLIEAGKAAGKPSDGRVAIASDLAEKWAASADTKLEAPDRVQPTGDVSVAESLARKIDNRDAFAALRSDFESFDLSEQKFPHPYFGDMTAVEWLVLTGGHEARHTAQVERLLGKIRQ